MDPILIYSNDGDLLEQKQLGKQEELIGCQWYVVM